MQALNGWSAQKAPDDEQGKKKKQQRIEKAYAVARLIQTTKKTKPIAASAGAT